MSPMKYRSFTLSFFLSFFFRPALSVSPTYINCQLEKPSGQSPLAGCPDGTIYVSPTDETYAKFSSVQEAINSLPATGNATILIGKGSYYEMLSVTRSAPLTLLGQIDTSAKRNGANNTVRIWNREYAGDGMSDEQTATLTLTAASDGSSFGNVDFKAYNINFENRAAKYNIAQALVTSITATNASFYGCAFASYQDTFYAGWEANTYVVDSTIYGQTDYIFGLGIAWFQSVILANRACGGGITAWQGTPGANNGVYIADSRVTRSSDANATTVTDNSCYLGRPWNEYAKAVFLRTYMDDSIQSGGFRTWDGVTTEKLEETVYFAEHNSYGPGGNTASRIAQDRILGDADAAAFTIESVFDGNPSWIDFGYKY